MNGIWERKMAVEGMNETMFSWLVLENTSQKKENEFHFQRALDTGLWSDLRLSSTQLCWP
jgi:hypothetical protein